MKVSIAIKALNEEQNIAACIRSALAALGQWDGEVILADSGSQDRTVEIAREFPVRIVQLANRSERSCGAGAQAAYQHAEGDYFYLVDGDMVLRREFLDAALRFIESHPDVAAVGGFVREVNLSAEDFQIRARSMAKDVHRTPGIVERLDGGGLYRMAALREADYFADRNLHCFEECELAIRLRTRGWQLARIDEHAVDHYGYQVGGYRLLWRRIRSGYTSGVGEIMRAAWANGHFGVMSRHLTHVRVCLLILAWWLVMVATVFAFPEVAVLLLLVPLVFLILRRRSVWLGLYSFLTWNIMTAGMIQGLLRRRVAATLPLATIELTAQNGLRESAHSNRKVTNRAGNAATTYEETSPCAF